MEITNDLKINITHLNTTKYKEIEILMRIKNNILAINNIIDKIIYIVNMDNERHISSLLVNKIKLYFEELNKMLNNHSIIGMKWFYSFSQEFIYLDLIFSSLQSLGWLLFNFPIADEKTWFVETNLGIKYHDIEESIKTMEEIKEHYSLYLVSHNYDILFIVENIHELINHANNNTSNIFNKIIIHELNILYEEISHRNYYSTVICQLIKLDGLFRYINIINCKTDGQNTPPWAGGRGENTMDPADNPDNVLIRGR
jgi:hypothetical protein